MYKHTSFFTKEFVTPRKNTRSSLEMEPSLKQSTIFDKSASHFKCAMSENHGIRGKYNCIEAYINCNEHTNSLPDFILASMATPELSSVQSCENLSAIEKKVEFLRATRNNMPVSFI